MKPYLKCRISSSLLLFLAGILYGFGLPPATAQEFVVNTYTPLNQSAPAVAAHSNGTFLVVWDSVEQDGSGTGVFARRLRPDGTPLGAEILVPTNTLGSQRGASVAELDDGRFIIAWGSTSPTGRVQARFFNASGAPLGGEFQLNADTVVSGLGASPTVVDNGFGGFAVVWTSDSTLGGVRFRLFDSSGTPTSSEIAVNSYTTGGQSASDVVPLDNGDFLVLWSSSGSASTDTDGRSVQGALVNSAGNIVGNQFQINTFTTTDQSGPRADKAPDGSVLVSWSSGDFFDDGGPDGSKISIQGQRFDSAGNFLGGEFQINTHTLDNQRGAEVIGVPEGFLVVWISRQLEGSSPFLFEDLYGQRLDFAGSPIGGEFQVTYNPLEVGRFSHAGALGEDGLPILTWQSEMGLATFEISAQRLPHFLLAVSPGRVSVCEGENAELDVTVTDDGTGAMDAITLTAPDVFAVFDPGTVSPGGSSAVTVETSALAPGAYPIKIVGDDGNALREEQSILTVLQNTPSAPQLLLPADGATNLEVSPRLEWAPGVQETYTVEVATDPAFTQVVQSVDAVEGSSYRPAPLEVGTEYFWRVRPTNACGVGNTSVTGSFTTDLDLLLLTGGVPDDEWMLDQEPQLAVISDAGEFVVATQRTYDYPYFTYRTLQVTTFDSASAANATFEVSDSDYYIGVPNSPSVGAAPSPGEFLVTWNYYGNGNAQLWNADGALEDQAIGSQKANTVSLVDSNGDFLVVWNSFDNIRGQHLSTNGTPLDVEYSISTNTTASHRESTAARNHQSDTFLVAWRSEGAMGSDDQGTSIRARCLAADGIPLGDEFQVNSFITGDQRLPSVSATGTADQFLVVWQSSDAAGDTDGTSIQGRRVDSCAPLGDEFQINTTTTGDQLKPSLAGDPTSEAFLVGWTSDSSSGTDTLGSSIQARHLDASGLPLGDDFQVNQYTTGDAYGVRVAASPGTRDFVVVWRVEDTVRAGRISPRALLFADGFESGNLEAWGAVTP